MSGESAMYKYGLFQNTVSEIEIVLGDGTIQIANKDNDPDLLREAGGSLGTFGVITLVTIQLLPAKSHIQLQIIPVSDPLTVPAIFEEATKDENIEYIDGIYFNRSSAVVMFGKMVDYAQRDPKAPLLTTKQIHWFADTIEKHLKKHNNAISTVTNSETKAQAKVIPEGSTLPTNIPPVLLNLTDYLFRYVPSSWLLETTPYFPY